MDSDSKTPIACSSCAKAKARCDKKRPCTRCVNKRRVCYPRTARRSADTSSQQRNRPAEEPWDPSVLEPRTSIDTNLHWSTAPLTPSSTTESPLSTVSGFGSNPFAGQRPRPGQPRASNQYPSNSVSQQVVQSVFAPADGSINDALSPAGQPFTDMEIDETNNITDGNGMLLLEETEYPLDFGIPPLSDLPLITDELSNIDNHSDFEARQVSATTVSDSGRAPFSSLGGYRFEIETQSDRVSPDPSRQSPLMTTSKSGNSVPEHKAVFAAQDRWSYFQCNPLIDSGPFSKTAKIYLEGLEHILESEDAWQPRDWQPQAIDTLYGGPGVQVEPFSSYARERFVAVTQAILQKAFDTHHIDSRSQPSKGSTEGRGFITLPPPIVLEHSLKAYVRRSEPYYSCVPAGSLKANELMQGGNARASCLLLLLMIAQGTAATPTMEARSLSSGLIEACRISLNELLEKDYELIQTLTVLQCGLLCTNVAAWSGDKYQMEFAIGQRGFYSSVLRSAGLLDFQYARPSREECRANPAKVWKEWKVQEGKLRLVVSWVFLDQELCLFLDQPPMLSLSCIRTPMPDSDQLWEADCCAEWQRIFDRASGSQDKPCMSIRDLFRFFMDGELANPNACLSPTQLRLLLHPIQSLVIHLQQILSCMPDGNGTWKAPQAVTKTTTLVRLEEVRSLLGHWYSLASRSSRHMNHRSPAMHANLIIYHLINLNTLVCLPEIEMFACREAKMAQLQPHPILKLDCAENAEQVFFHCGQILRLIRLMPEDVRPPWWPAAVYRAALAAWTTSMTKARARSLLSSLGRDTYQSFAIDAVTPEDSTLVQYLHTGEGQPMLLKRNGTMVSLEIPQNILVHWVELLSEKCTTRFQDAIRNKLTTLMERWKNWKIQ